MLEQFGTRGRGPLGTPNNSPVSDAGTSALVQNKPHVPLGATSTPRRQPRRSLGGNREHRTLRLPDLKIGTRRQHVERLQRLLNSHLDGKPGLKLDGIFGPKTLSAVIQFQKNSELNPDGIVGRRTWFALIIEDPKQGRSTPSPKASTGFPNLSGTGPATARTPSAATPPAPAPAKEKSVDEWSLYERFEYVVLHTGSHLTGNLRSQFAALLTKTGLAYVIGALVVWGVSQFLGIGEVLDAALLLYAGFSAGHHLGTFILLTCTASTKKELEDAASNLAEAIEILGVIAFFALLSRVARLLRARVNAAEEGGVAPKEEAPSAPKEQSGPEKPQPSSEAKSSNQSGKEESGEAAERPVPRTGHSCDAKARAHILDGDATGGGHGPGRGVSGKSEFPSDWSDEDVINEVESVSNDPASKATPQGSRTRIDGTRNGVDIRVIVEGQPGAGGRIVTGFPTNVPRNP